MNIHTHFMKKAVDHLAASASCRERIEVTDVVGTLINEMSSEHARKNNALSVERAYD